ncbi:MAG: DUF3383 family protein, partial [Acidiferrobacterales bacterium]|nr:DUF3383 family protein [Acidiferrobacterales bacterium]
MSYPVENIINVVTRIRPGGIGTANFGQGMLFAPADDLTVGPSFPVKTFLDFGSLSALSEYFAESTETYKAARKWFSGSPAPREIRVYLMDNSAPNTQTAEEAVNDAIEQRIWWYWTMFTASEYDISGDAGVALKSLVSTCDAASKFIIVAAQDPADIRNPALDTDTASILQTQGSRRCFVFAHADAEGAYGGFTLAGIFSRVLFNAPNSVISGEFKKLPGTDAEDLAQTAYNAMKAKGAVFYTKVETGGQVDNGRVINSISTSTFNESIAAVFNLDAFVNAATVNLYNAVANPNIVDQTPKGQNVAITAAKQTGEQYITNGYLGARQYVDNDTGETKISRGYEVTTKPE